MIRRPRTVLPALAVPLAAVLLAGCSAADSADLPDPTGVPERWLTETAAAWPESDAFGAVLPVTAYGEDCLLTEDEPELLGHPTQLTDTGFGPWQDEDDAASYRYLCGLWAPDELSGELQVVQTADAAELTATVEEFTGQQSTAQQDNAVEAVTSRGLEVQVLSRWYPTNPQGEYQALYADEAAGAFVVLEINSLDREAFDAATPQDAADALTGLLAAG